MARASQQYLAELADEFLALMVRISWDDHSRGARGKTTWGETTWIDARGAEPGVDVSTNFRRLPDDAIEVEVIAYDSTDKDNVVTRKGVVAR